MKNDIVLTEEVRQFYLDFSKTFTEMNGNRIKLFKSDGEIVSYHLYYYKIKGDTIICKATGKIVEYI